MLFLQAINSDLSVLIVCNKTGGSKRRYNKNINSENIQINLSLFFFISHHLRFLQFPRISDPSSKSAHSTELLPQERLNTYKLLSWLEVS